MAYRASDGCRLLPRSTGGRDLHDRRAVEAGVTLRTRDQRGQRDRQGQLRPARPADRPDRQLRCHPSSLRGRPGLRDLQRHQHPEDQRLRAHPERRLPPWRPWDQPHRPGRRDRQGQPSPCSPCGPAGPSAPVGPIGPTAPSSPGAGRAGRPDLALETPDALRDPSGRSGRCRPSDQPRPSDRWHRQGQPHPEGQ